jgi:hypothetical protein
VTDRHSVCSVADWHRVLFSGGLAQRLYSGRLAPAHVSSRDGTGSFQWRTVLALSALHVRLLCMVA